MANETPAPHARVGPAGDHARLETRLAAAALAELEIARAGIRRLEKELRIAEARVAAADTARSAAEARLAERERYVAELHRSRGWQLLQGLRGLFGRRW